MVADVGRGRWLFESRFAGLFPRWGAPDIARLAEWRVWTFECFRAMPGPVFLVCDAVL